MGRNDPRQRSRLSLDEPLLQIFPVKCTDATVFVCDGDTFLFQGDHVGDLTISSRLSYSANMEDPETVAELPDEPLEFRILFLGQSDLHSNYRMDSVRHFWPFWDAIPEVFSDKTLTLLGLMSNLFICGIMSVYPYTYTKKRGLFMYEKRKTRSNHS